MLVSWFLSVACASGQGPAQLQVYDLVRETKLDEATTAFAEKLEPALSAYNRALNTAYERHKAAGNLEGALAASDEMKRVDAGGAAALLAIQPTADLEAIKVIQQKVLAAAKKYQASLKVQQAAIEKEYLEKLETLKVDLVKGDRIDEAQVVNERIKDYQAAQAAKLRPRFKDVETAGGNASQERLPKNLKSFASPPSVLDRTLDKAKPRKLFPPKGITEANFQLMLKLADIEYKGVQELRKKTKDGPKVMYVDRQYFWPQLTIGKKQSVTLKNKQLTITVYDLQDGRTLRRERISLHDFHQTQTIAVRASWKRVEHYEIHITDGENTTLYHGATLPDVEPRAKRQFQGFRGPRRFGN